MNFQNNQIQAIINEIDQVLNQSSTENSPVTLQKTLQKSQKILQQILDYLTHDVDRIRSLQPLSFDPSQANENAIDSSTEKHPEPIAEVLAHRSQYLHEEEALKILQQQRQALLEEIRRLERQRQENYSLAQQYAKQQQIISEFSQALLGPVQETLVEHLSQLANQHPSQIQGAIPTNQNRRPQTIKDVETSELMTISVDKLDEESNLYESFVDDSNTADNNIDRNINLPAKINHIKTEQAPKREQSNKQINQIALPYPGYEFFDTNNTESTTESTTETTEILTNQPAYTQAKASRKKQQKLDKLEKLEKLEKHKSQNSDKSQADLLEGNRVQSQLEAPSFEENNSEPQKSQNHTPKIEKERVTKTNKSPLPAASKLDEAESIENTEMIESLSHLFGELMIDEEQDSQLVFPQEITENQTTVKASKSEKDTYIQASSKENLLPVKEQEEKPEIELLLDSDTLEQLRYDLEHLEALELDDLILDETQETRLQLGEYPAVYSTKNTPAPADNPFVIASEEELINLEDLFGDITRNSRASHFENFADEEEQEMESEPTIEEILDSLTSSTAAETTETATETEIETEIDNQEFITLESLLQDTPNQEKKKFSLQETADTNELSQPEFSVNLEPDIFDAQKQITATPIDSKTSKVKEEIKINNLTSNQRAAEWYLGIDFGTTGISAALLNRSSGKIYPLYWQRLETKLELELDIPVTNQEFTLSKKADQNKFSYPQKIYRLPSIVYIQPNLQEANDTEKTLEQTPLLLQDFKPSLKISIPYLSIKFRREKLEEKPEESFLLASNFGASTSHQPVLQWSENHQIPLSVVKQGLVALLTTIQPETSANNSISLVGRETQTSVTLPNDYVCGAVGLDKETFASALAQLKRVIMGYPASWPEAYRFNLREAVLAANLVRDVSQVIVISDAMATALSELTSVTEDNQVSSSSEFKRGGILIVNVGATTTELALCSLDNMQNLSYSHFHCHSFAYGGHALDQDIVCQLLLTDNGEASSQYWPQPGYPDLAIRYQLQQWLQSSSYRQGFLEAARNLKVILPHENEFTLDLGDRFWNLQQKDLETKVLEPFVEQLNRELNNLLSRAGMSPVGIKRAICTGGSGVWSAIARWLRQKLPNAIIVQDGIFEPPNVDLGEESDPWLDDFSSGSQDIKLMTGRVAYGLATLPLYPQIADIPQQQYSDYFLLWEILRVFPDYPLSGKEVIQLLEKRGINTRVCQDRIKAILAGQLPPGLIPSEEDVMLLSEISRQNSDYQGLRGKRLFCKETDGRRYRLSDQQAEYVREYLSKLVASSGQKLEEPLLRSF